MWRTMSGAHRSSTTCTLPRLRSAFQRSTSCLLRFVDVVDVAFLAFYPHTRVSGERITLTALPKVPTVCVLFTSFRPRGCARDGSGGASSVPQWCGNAHAQCTQPGTHPRTQSAECEAVPDGRLALRRERACNHALL